MDITEIQHTTNREDDNEGIIALPAKVEAIGSSIP